MMNVTKLLAEWCARYTLAFPASAIEQAQTAMIDTVGCILAGMEDPAVLSAAKVVSDCASGVSSSVRHGAGVAATWAAMINACAAHALDFDDNFFPAITHASAVLVPALFAVAEEIGAPPADIIRAYICGLEVEAQLGKMCNPSHYDLGWHATSTIGVVGAAAACATLMRLDQEGVLHAMSIATSLAGGSKKQFGTMVKPMHAGFAAMHGVMAAQLSRAGMRGNDDILQGKWSFQALFSGEHTDHVFAPALFPAAPLAIDEYGLVAKLYPSCMSSHLGIDAMLALRNSHAVDFRTIDRVDIHLPGFMVANLRHRMPADQNEARFSMQYCAAVALVHGAPRMMHFSEAALADQDVMLLIDKVHMHEREAAPALKSLPWRGDCLARITTTDGAILEHQVLYPAGCSKNRLSEAQVRDKFSDCVQMVMDTTEAASLYAKLAHFSTLASIRDVTSAMTGRQTRAASIVVPAAA